MSYKFIALSIGGLLLAPAAHATIIDGSFSGTLGSGTDISGVFNEAPGSNLSGDTVTGTFVYNTASFTGTPSGSTEQYTATGPGALTVTLTINGVSHIFTDSANSSIYLDSSGTSEVTYVANASSIIGSTSVSDTFVLDVIDPSNPFVASTSLNQSFSTTNPDVSTGTFSINDSNPTLAANGSFTLGALSQAPAPTATPEPASLALLTVGVAGLAGLKRRRTIR